MKFYPYIFTILSLLSFDSMTYAQDTDSVKSNVQADIIAFQIGLGGNVPGGDLSDRYGANLNFSIGGEYISKSDWIVSPELFYFYGDNIKEDVLAPYRSKEGFLLGDDQQIVEMTFSQRGMYLGLGLGKHIKFRSDNRSGIGILIGGGLMAHKIKFSDSRNALAQTRAGRAYGYDRLTRGFTLKESISYKYFSNDRRLNIDFAFDFFQGFTDEVRAINFDTGLPTIKDRLDLMYGIRLIWTLPYYRGGVERVVYY